MSHRASPPSGACAPRLPRPLTLEEAHRLRVALEDGGLAPRLVYEHAFGAQATEHLISAAIAHLQAHLDDPAEVPVSVTALFVLQDTPSSRASEQRRRALDHPLRAIRQAALMTIGAVRGDGHLDERGEGDKPSRPRARPAFDHWWALTSPHPGTRWAALHALSNEERRLFLPAMLRQSSRRRHIVRQRWALSGCLGEVVELVESGDDDARSKLALARAVVATYAGRNGRLLSQNDRLYALRPGDMDGLLDAEVARWRGNPASEAGHPTQEPSAALCSDVARFLRLVRWAGCLAPGALAFLLPPEEEGALPASLVLAVLLYAREGGAVAPRVWARLVPRVPALLGWQAIPAPQRLATLRAIVCDPQLPALEVRSARHALDDASLARCAIEDSWPGALALPQGIVLLDLLLRALPHNAVVRFVAEWVPEPLLEHLFREGRWVELLLAHRFTDAERRQRVLAVAAAAMVERAGSSGAWLAIARVMPPDLLPTLWAQGLGRVMLQDALVVEQVTFHRPLSRRQAEGIGALLRAGWGTDPTSFAAHLRALSGLQPGTSGVVMLALVALATDDPRSLVDALVALPDEALGGWADQLLFHGAFPASFEGLLVSALRGRKEPRVVRYVEALRQPVSFFPKEEARERMRDLYVAHVEAAQRVRAALPSSAGRVSKGLRGNQKPPAVPGLPEGVYRGRRWAEQKRQGSRRAAMGGGVQAYAPAAWHAARRAYVAHCPEDGEAWELLGLEPPDLLAELTYRSLTDRRGAARCALFVLCRAPQVLMPREVVGDIGPSARVRQQQGDSEDRDALVDLALEGATSGDWIALSSALLGARRAPEVAPWVKGLLLLAGSPLRATRPAPEAFCRLLDRVPDRDLPSILAWMQDLGPRHPWPPQALERVAQRVDRLPAAVVGRHREALRRWTGEVTDPNLRRALGRRVCDPDERADRLRLLQELYVWTRERAQQLAGREVQVELVADTRLGAADLKRGRLLINVLPWLRGDRDGRSVVEGLVLHELGHVAWHSTKPFTEAWRMACRNREECAMNVLLDEHLERRIRSIHGGWGRRLQALNRWAFVDGMRLRHALEVVVALGPCALDEAVGAWLRSERVQAGPDAHLVMAADRDLRRLRARFDRILDDALPFLHDLRLGRGARGVGARGRAALALFGDRLADEDAAGLQARAKVLAALWHDQHKDPWGRDWEWEEEDSPPTTGLRILVVGRDTLTEEGVEEPWGSGADLLGGITVEELEEAMSSGARVVLAEGRPRAGRSLNLSPSLAIPPLVEAPFRPADPTEEAALLKAMGPWGAGLARELEALGTRETLGRRHHRGARVAQGALASSVLTGDPRVLLHRRAVVRPNFFLGMAIDASGSMAMAGRLKRAAELAATLWLASGALRDATCEVIAFNEKHHWPCVLDGQSAFSALVPCGGNNDGAALRWMGERALASSAEHKVVVMLSDGSPTGCSVEALRHECVRLSGEGVALAQLSLRRSPDTHVFPHTVEVDPADPRRTWAAFAMLVQRLALS